MMENWEKALICRSASLPAVAIADGWTDGTFLFITLLFWISFLTYAPGHLAYLSRRFSYYVFEDESVNVGLLIWEWLAEQARRGWKGAKGVSESGGAGIEEMRRTSGAGGGKAEL